MLKETSKYWSSSPKKEIIVDRLYRCQKIRIHFKDKISSSSNLSHTFLSPRRQMKPSTLFKPIQPLRHFLPSRAKLQIDHGEFRVTPVLAFVHTAIFPSISFYKSTSLLHTRHIKGFLFYVKIQEDLPWHSSTLKLNHTISRLLR